MLWSHGGYLTDKDDKVIINSPETAKALEYVKALYDTFHPRHRVLERQFQQQGLSCRRAAPHP